MMKEIIYINKNNFGKYLNLDIVAFSFAYGGAQGSSGEINVITRDAQIYRMNYVFGDMRIEMCDEVCPPLKYCIFGFWDVETTPDGWKGISLGAGNFLVLADSVYGLLHHELLNFPPPIRYVKWMDMVINCLKTNNR